MFRAARPAAAERAAFLLKKFGMDDSRSPAPEKSNEPAI